MTAVVRGRWFPAMVKLPDKCQPWSRCLVIAADDGLHVFQGRADRADWYSPADWTVSPLPSTDREAKRGFDVHTEAGLAVVTKSHGCQCGVMARWAGPSWVQSETIRT